MPDKATAERNSDGSCVVTLSETITVDGEKIARVTIPRITGRHMFKCPVINGESSLGPVVEWSSHVVLPKGSVEEMTPEDALFVAEQLLLCMGKSKPAGAPPSP